MLHLIKAGEEALDEAKRLTRRYGDSSGCSAALSDVKFLSPVPTPEQIRDMSLFPQHICAAGAGMRRIGAERKNLSLDDCEFRPLSKVPDIFKQQPIFYFHNRHNVLDRTRLLYGQHTVT